MSDEVALQLLLSLGDLDIEDARGLNDGSGCSYPGLTIALMRDATLSSLGRRETGFFKPSGRSCRAECGSPGLKFLLEALGQAVVKSRDPDAIGSLLSRLEKAKPDWAKEAVLGGVSVYGPALIRQPVKLDSKPAVVENHAELSRYFAWPGHTPEAPEETDARPLTEEEEALFARGRQIYLTFCVACHGADGLGAKLLAPPLAGSDWVEGSEERLVRVLLHGLSGSITVSGRRYAAPDVQPLMPPVASLSNADIAAVMTYIRRGVGQSSRPGIGECRQPAANPRPRPNPALDGGGAGTICKAKCCGRPSARYQRMRT